MRRRARVALGVALAVVSAGVCIIVGLGSLRGRGNRSSSPAVFVLGRSTTSLDPDQKSRNQNVALAAASLNGAVVEPGGEFSFNGVVGERGEEQGYGPARVIVDGKSESGIAGGICQLSSTMYNAALLAGMEITERRPHSRPVPYLPAGLDATVSYGARDLRWVNTRAEAVTVRAAVDGPRVAVWIEGDSEGPEIRLFTQTVEVIPPRPMAPPDPTGRATTPSPPGARTIAQRGSAGYRVQVWAERQSSDGGRTRELVSTDLYEPVNAVVK
ncbi:MAG: VanW family protein [Clostridia bacterium]|nr:VanW family protein [Clostridia bacterium]